MASQKTNNISVYFHSSFTQTKNGQKISTSIVIEKIENYFRRGIVVQFIFYNFLYLTGKVEQNLKDWHRLSIEKELFLNSMASINF